MKRPPQERNRTGMALSPKHAKELVEGASHTVPSMAGDEKAIASVRASYTSDGDSIGSIPPPATLAGVAAGALRATTGAHLGVLLDKVGERLAFERTGTRLYDALISKADAGTSPGGPTRAVLARFRDQEHQHSLMLQDVMVALGGDPTALTPSADVSAVLSMGVPQVLLDARTDFGQCLEAMLLAELADHDGWELLIDLARALGEDGLAARFTTALEEEEQHLSEVRRWVKQSTLARAGRPRAAEEVTR